MVLTLGSTLNLTGLMWLKDTNCFGNKTWENALATVADFNTENRATYDCSEYTAEYTDWHLPCTKEMISLFDRKRVTYAGHTALPYGHPFLVVADGSDASFMHWTSTSVLAGFPPPKTAWQISLYGRMETDLKSYGHRVWPVRGGVKCYGDCHGDGDVDGADLAEFVADFASGVPGEVCQFDFNNDGLVDVQDLTRFLADFGRAGCPHQDTE